MKAIRYCPFYKIEHEGILRGYRCNKFNRNFKIKEYNEDRNYN